MGDDIEQARSIMMEASRIVIGQKIPIDCNRCDYPDRFYDEDGDPMWQRIRQLVPEVVN